MLSTTEQKYKGQLKSSEVDQDTLVECDQMNGKISYRRKKSRHQVFSTILDFFKIYLFRKPVLSTDHKLLSWLSRLEETTVNQEF